MSGAVETPAVAAYALALGDDALVAAHRLGQWITRAPQLEEDVALGNIGLDLLGQGRTLLAYAAELEGAGRDEDALAFRRDAPAFRNATLVELDNGDFAVSMARLLLFSTYQLGLYERLSTSTDETLAGMAAKAVKEVSYHRDHATEWVLRLGDGTDESRRRMQAGLDLVWPYADELFTTDWFSAQLLADAVAVDASALHDDWRAFVSDVLVQATLTEPEPESDRPAETRGGRRGDHTPALAEMLDEMQSVHRAHPGATW